MFRFNYSKEFLLWALTPPGYSPDWHIGVRVVKTKKLVAFISGIKAELRVRSKSAIVLSDAKCKLTATEHSTRPRLTTSACTKSYGASVLPPCSSRK